MESRGADKLQRETNAPPPQGPGPDADRGYSVGRGADL
jgi:hypothetical protein